MPPLPSYRSLYNLRYHPYPRPTRGRGAEGRIMGNNLGEDRFETTGGELAAVSLGHQLLEGNIQLELDPMYVDDGEDLAREQVPQPTEANVRVIVAFVNMLYAVRLRRKLVALLAVAEFLRAGGAKPE